jgi:hypothetical protein
MYLVLKMPGPNRIITVKGSMTIGVTKQLKGHPAEPEAKKLQVLPSDPKEATGEEEKTSTT